MANDMEIIKQIEKQTGKKLKALSREEIWKDNGYALDNNTGQVQGLNLDGREIKDISFISSLSELTQLFLRRNQITNLTPLSLLTNLTGLDLNGNQIRDLTPLSTLKDLTWLSLNTNKIRELTPLSALKNLNRLYLSYNQIRDLMPLSALTNLILLNLHGNRITDLAPLRELKHLNALDVSNNCIQRLPPQITSWWPSMGMAWEDTLEVIFLNGLNLYNNPLTDPPEEIVKKGRAAVENYFAEIQRASVHFLESKLLLVGSGDVGKTTLMKKLKDNDFVVEPGKEDTTRGVDIQPWNLNCPFPDGQTHDVNIHFWDFGGQEILHATHQFFLTKRSLYIFVWEPRKEEEIQSFDYWLNAVKLLGAESPIIVVMNKLDIRVKQIDAASLKEKFPNIVQFLQVSCTTGRNIPDLTETIRDAFCKMPHLLDKLPKRWMDIRDSLKAMKQDVITIDSYFDVCRAQGMEDDKALFLSDYLHDLGIILHFRTDAVLADTVILKPEWATGAVYALIDSPEIQENKGKFNRSNLNRYWGNKKYPPDKYPQLLRLMEKFELCFNIVGADEYIIPELLPAERPPVDFDSYRSPSTRNLHLQYSYDFMPAGIVTRFISRIHYLIRADRYWKNGVELTFSGSTAVVVGDSVQKRIRVDVSGSNMTQLMGVIRSHFDHIHETLNMKKDEHVFEEVPCICSQCLRSPKPHYYKYNVLQKFMAKGLDAICEKSVETVSIRQLLNGLLPPEKSEILFDSILTTLSQVQGITKTLHTDENSRNTIVALLLGTRGFRVKDQTLWARSVSGKHMGELDIKIEDETGRAVSIIEALNLDKWNTANIDRHVKKLLIDYDCNGLKENYIVVYVSAADFNGLCRKYRQRLEEIDYESYGLIGGIDDVPTGLNKIKAYRARHRCNDGETILYHLLAEM